MRGLGIQFTCYLSFLGGAYVVDFLILSAHSGAWHTVLIELESPTARPFTKSGNPSKALAKGLGAT
jgi:hypothetical protein